MHAQAADAGREPQFHLAMYLMTTFCCSPSLWSTACCTMPSALRLSVRVGVKRTAFKRGALAEEAVWLSQLPSTSPLWSIE
jgi:hypothetical protein